MRRTKPSGLKRAGGIALWLLGAAIMLAGIVQMGMLVAQQERLAQAAITASRPPPPAALQQDSLPEGALTPVAADSAQAYPAKGRNRASPWGCAAFDEDGQTPPPSVDGVAEVTLAPRTTRSTLVGYQLVAGTATDTLVPDLAYFKSCLETGLPEQVVEVPARRSSAAFPASRWAMDAVELDVTITPRAAGVVPARLRIEVAQSRPDRSPYVEALPVEEPFGSIWLLDHGSTPVATLMVGGQVYPAVCEGLGEAGQPPRFQRAVFDALTAGDGRPAVLAEPRRRVFDLSSELSAIPAAAAMQTWRACDGPDCETQAAFRERNQTLAAAGYCDLNGQAIWRVRVDARLSAPNPADAARPYVSAFSTLLRLEPPGPLMAAPVYRAPAPGAVGLRSDAEGYALGAAVGEPDSAGRYRIRLRLAAPETSTHLLRLVAVDSQGGVLGSSRWTHILAFTSQAAAPAPVSASAGPAAPTAPVTRAAASSDERFAAADNAASAPLPNP